MKEALKLALEALEIEEAQTHYPSRPLVKAITAIKEALSSPNGEAQQALDRKAENARELGLDYEPVAVVKENPFCPEGLSDELTVYLPVGTRLYTTPPQRTWVGLTDEEAVEVMRQVPHLTIGGLLSVEAKLKEKNT